MNQRNSHPCRAAAAGLVAGVIAVATAQADGGEPVITLDRIVVTAQKREQNLQDVPIVVTAVSGQLLQDTGVKDIKSLTLLTPGLTVTSTTSEAATTARIRGIGTVGDNPGLESSVGVVIDGVYRPRAGVGFGDLGEIERIEVLKGPQGTLFGKNVDAGVINVITKKPSDKFGITGAVTGGNYNDRGAAASITGPLAGNSVTGRLYMGFEKRDGFLDVGNGVGPSTHHEANDRNYYTTRGQLMFGWDKADLRLIGDYSKRVESCCAAVQTVSGPFVPAINGITAALTGGTKTGMASGTSLDPYERQAYANRLYRQDIRDMGFSAELNADIDALGDARLTSITAWRDWSMTGGADVDFTGLDIFYRPDDDSVKTGFKQLSEEIRLGGQFQAINWLVGAYYSDERLDYRDSIVAGSDLNLYLSTIVSASGATPVSVSSFNSVAQSGSKDAHHQKSTSYALFSNETWTITEGLDLILGARYTHEKKDLMSSFYEADGGAGCAGLFPPPAGLNATQQQIYFGYGCSTYFNPGFANLHTAQSRDENNLSGTAKLAYRPMDELMIYGSYARGYKAGGFNLERVVALVTPPIPTPVTDTHFGAETVNSFELGAKATLLDKTMLVDAAIFEQKYKDFQLNTFAGVSYSVTSINEVESKGVDVDLTWLTPLSGLSFRGGVTYANTSITDFGATAIALFASNRENDRLSFAPLWTGTMSGTYAVPLSSSLELRTNVGYKYSSSYNTGSNLDPHKNQGAYGLLNARIGLGSPTGSWMAEVWGQNLTNKGYYQVAIDGPLQSGQFDAFLGDPRTYGLTLRVKL